LHYLPLFVELKGFLILALTIKLTKTQQALIQVLHLIEKFISIYRKGDNNIIFGRGVKKTND